LRNRSSLKSSRFSKLHGPSPWPISSIRRRAAGGRQILKEKLQYTRALMPLAAEDAEAHKILAEVRSLLKPQSALREPELASRVMAMMAQA
jgi:hypothetical protein